MDGGWGAPFNLVPGPDEAGDGAHPPVGPGGPEVPASQGSTAISARPPAPHSASKCAWDSWDKSPAPGGAPSLCLPPTGLPARRRGLLGRPPLPGLCLPGVSRFLLWRDPVTEGDQLRWSVLPLQKNKFINGPWQAVYYRALTACLLPPARLFAPPRHCPH